MIRKLTLHEAIVKVLQNKKGVMTTQQIANELNKNKWYVKKDKSLIEPFQIHGRTRNYPQLFFREGSLVSLQQINIKTSVKKKSKASEVKTQTFGAKEKVSIENSLMKNKSFKTGSEIDNKVPDVPGLYCIRVTDVNALPKAFKDELLKRDHDFLYIGIASKSLKKRMLNQELRAKGHGTFFRSLGAVLGYRPIKGSLRGKQNKRNYKFSLKDETEIINWINRNILISWVEYSSDLAEVETGLILKYKPILNIAKNPFAFPLVSSLRSECVEIANS